MPPQFINPLSMIGQSTNQPDVAGANKALKDLQTRHLLTDITNKSLEGRTAATNLSAERRTAMPFGLQPGTPGYAEGLRRLEESTSAKRGAETGSTMQRGGYAMTDPKTPVVPGQMHTRGFTGGAALPAAAAAKIASQFTTGQQEGATFKGVRKLPGGKFEEYEYFRKYDQTGQSKNDPRIQQYVDELHKRVADKYGGNPVIMGETKTHLSVSFDGKNPVRIRKDPTKTK
jgi:hypothetical protein